MKTTNRIKPVSKLAVALVCLLDLISIAQSEETKQLESPKKNQTNAIASQFDTYKNPKFKFQISYPKDWRTATSVNDAVWKIAKTTTDEIGSLSISVARYTGNDPAFLNKMLDQGEAMLQELRRRFPDGEFLDRGKTFLGSFPAVYFKAKYSVKNLGTDTKIIMVQIMCIRDNLMYVASFETTEGSYPKTQPQFQAIISTFIFASTESAPPDTSIKAFDNLFFGEEKAVVEKKRKNRVLVGDNEFDLFCFYAKIGGKEILSDVCLKAKWMDLEKSGLENKVKEIEKILTAKFGKPQWKTSGNEKEKPDEPDEIGTLQFFWEIPKEKTIHLWKIDKWQIESLKVKDDSFPGKLFGREKDSFDIRMESRVTILIGSPAIKEMKAKESDVKSKEAGASF